MIGLLHYILWILNAFIEKLNMLLPFRPNVEVQQALKELMKYLEFLYFGKGNISHICDVGKTFYQSKKHDRSLTVYFMDLNVLIEKLTMLLPFNPNVKLQQAHCEQMAIMSFLASLPSEYYTAKSQILSRSEISSMIHSQEAFVPRLLNFYKLLMVLFLVTMQVANKVTREETEASLATEVINAI